MSKKQSPATSALDGLLAEFERMVTALNEVPDKIPAGEGMSLPALVVAMEDARPAAAKDLEKLFSKTADLDALANKIVIDQSRMVVAGMLVGSTYILQNMADVVSTLYRSPDLTEVMAKATRQLTTTMQTELRALYTGLASKSSRITIDTRASKRHKAKTKAADKA
jgi:hypothetical protein